MADRDLTASYEDYIEAIYDLSVKGTGIVRSVDVAEELGYSKASVARAIKNLREDGLIEQERYGAITLTEKGEELGRAVLERHTVLRAFLIDILGVDKETANEEACMMEHTICQDTMDKWAAWYYSQQPEGSAIGEGLLPKKGNRAS